MKQIQDFKPEVLPHPPYLPDLAPSDFLLFWPVKDAVRVLNFRSDEEVEEAERDCLAQKPYTEEFMSEEKVGRGVWNVMGTALTINVIALYLFL